MQENGIDMYKPHLCKFILTSGGLDLNRNPIVGNQEDSPYFEAFFDSNLPNEVVFTPDGEIVSDVSGIIYLDRDILSNIDFPLKIGYNVEVFNKDTLSLVFSGRIKSFNKELFHTRVWV